jgi:metal transporter CNNM
MSAGLMSLDNTELEVLIRSGTPKEQRAARKIMPVIKNSHHLLVTLLLTNAIASTVSGASTAA